MDPNLLSCYHLKIISRRPVASPVLQGVCWKWMDGLIKITMSRIGSYTETGPFRNAKPENWGLYDSICLWQSEVRVVPKIWLFIHRPTAKGELRFRFSFSGSAWRFFGKKWTGLADIQSLYLGWEMSSSWKAKLWCNYLANFYPFGPDRTIPI